MNDPYDRYRRLRADGAVVRVADATWAVTRYEAVAAALGDTGAFAQAGTDADDVLAGADPPAHTRQRALVGHAWSVARTEAVSVPIVREVAGALVDGLRPRGTADLVGGFAAPLAARVLGRVLGIGEPDLGRVRSWVERDLLTLGGPLGADDRAAAEGARAALRAYLGTLVAARRAAPADDAISLMVHARAAGHEPLTDAEVVSISQQVLVAGTETVKNLLAIATLEVLGHTCGHGDRVAGARLTAGAVEEALRLDAPVQSLVRIARTDVDLAGTRIPAGDAVVVLLGSANRDPRRFADPDRFDPARRAARAHLAFGHGAHFCLGAPLARAEARIALPALLSGLPGLRLDHPGAVTWSPHPFWRRLSALRARWRA